MGFWDKHLGAPQSTVITGVPFGAGDGPARAWWQEHDPYARTGVSSSPVAQEHQAIDPRQLHVIRKKGHQQISPEEAEAIASYDLATKAKYQGTCPECGSGNFILAGTRMPTGMMTTDKCFDCGHAARGASPGVGGRGGGGTAARQIDTGGAGGVSMYGQFRGVPQSYMPRA